MSCRRESDINLRLTTGVLVRGHLGFECHFESNGGLVNVDLGEGFELRLKEKD